MSAELEGMQLPNLILNAEDTHVCVRKTGFHEREGASGVLALGLAIRAGNEAVG